MAAPLAGMPPMGTLSTTTSTAAPETSTAGELGPARTGSGDFPGLLVDPSCFDVARRTINTLEEQHKHFADEALRVCEAYKTSKASIERQRRDLDDARQALAQATAESTTAAGAEAAAKKELQLALV